MIAKKAVRLADLEESAGDVILPSGREVAVKHIDGRSQQVFAAYQTGAALPGDLWKVAALLLPDATPEEILELTPGAITIVVQMASGQLAAVLELAEAVGKMKAPSPAAPTSEAGIG